MAQALRKSLQIVRNEKPSKGSVMLPFTLADQSGFVMQVI